MGEKKMIAGLDRRAASSAAKRRAVSAYKMQRGCTDCGVVPAHPSMLDLDHLDPATKLDNVSDLISQDYGWEVIWAEVSKCETVCKSCHTERTRARKAAEAGTRAERAAALGLEPAEDSLEAVLQDLTDLYWRLAKLAGYDV
jgi:hypothetical protein